MRRTGGSRGPFSPPQPPHWFDDGKDGIPWTFAPRTRVQYLLPTSDLSLDNLPDLVRNTAREAAPADHHCLDRVPDMPKTRSGKIMRRVLAAISNTMEIGDVTSLANPDVVEDIRIAVQGGAKNRILSP